MIRLGLETLIYIYVCNYTKQRNANLTTNLEFWHLHTYVLCMYNRGQWIYTNAPRFYSIVWRHPDSYVKQIFRPPCFHFFWGRLPCLREGVKINLIVADMSVTFWPPPRMAKAGFADTEKIRCFFMVYNAWFRGKKFQITWNPPKYIFLRFRAFCIFFSNLEKKPI